jgi:hypothetical protein
MNAKLAEYNIAESAFVEGSPWGLGVYETPNGKMYGYPPKGTNPHNFWPDEEACFAEELEAHLQALHEWDNKRVSHD